MYKYDDITYSAKNDNLRALGIGDLLVFAIALLSIALLASWCGAQPAALEQPAQRAPETSGTTVAELAELLPRATSSSLARFGWSVAVDGDTMVVGTIYDDENGINAGAAWVFQRDQGGAGAWGMVTKLVDPYGEAGDQLGVSVAVSGDTIVVGADSYSYGSGMVYVFERDHGGSDAWGSAAGLHSPNDDALDTYFGRAVAISGDTVVVGAYGTDPDGVYCGNAHVFERDLGGDWSVSATLRNVGGANNDFYGTAVAIAAAGNTVAVGAPNKSGTGMAFLYGRDQGGAGAWGELAALTAADGQWSDEFGSSIAVSQDIAIVGAEYNSSSYFFSRDQGGADAWGQLKQVTGAGGCSMSGDTAMVGEDRGTGKVHVYGRDHGGSDTWGKITTVLAADPAPDDRFGYSLAVNGDIAVVSAPYDDDMGADSGSVYLLARDEGGADAWGQVAKQAAPLTPSARFHRFGTSVDIDAGIAVVGAPRDNDNGLQSGSAYVFARDEDGAGMWGEMAKLIPSDGAQDHRFGTAVAVSGDTIIIGNDGPSSAAEAAYLYTWDTGAGWSEQARLSAFPDTGGTGFGKAVAIDGDTAVVAAPDGEGKAYVFAYRSFHGVWDEAALLSAPAGAFGFGTSVAISGDTIIIGAPDSTIAGPWTGAAFVYREQGGIWVPEATLTAAAPREGDLFGCSVAIDGDTALVGAEYDEGMGFAQVFKRDGSGYWLRITTIETPVSGYLNFGRSVAISGNTLAITDGRSDVFLYSLDEGGAGAWGQTATVFRDIWGFGNSIALDRDRPAGAPFLDTMIAGASWADAVGLLSGSATVFGIDEPPPSLTLVNTSADTGDGELGDGEMTAAGIHMIHLSLSRSAYDPVGDSDPHDVSNPAGYLLLEAGADGTLETGDCASGVAASDTAIPVGPVSWDPDTLTADLVVGSGQSLGNGLFRLLACGSSIIGLDGRPLDGDGDGVAGGDLQRSFRVDRFMPVNPVVTSTSHVAGALSRHATADLLWFGASDSGGSGLAGYSILLDTSTTSTPDTSVDLVHLAADPQEHSFGPLADGKHWFHLRTCDHAGGCAPTRHFGPLWIDATPPSTVGNLFSPSHDVGVPSAATTVEMTWDAAVDASSAVAGYSCELSATSGSVCSQVPSVIGTSTSITADDGTWYFHICAVDAAGNWGSVVTAGPYLIDTTGPQVSLVGSVSDTGDGAVQPGEITAAAITQLYAWFDEAVWDPAGDSTTGDVSNPASYLLIGDGGDGVLGTGGCDGGPAADDVALSIDQVLYDAPARRAALQVNGGLALAAGSYRLLVCSTIRDEAGHALDGNGDGVSGDDLRLDLEVTASNLLNNPNLDGTLEGWKESTPVIGYSAADCDLAPTSGAAEIDGTGGTAGVHTLSQCVELDGEPGLYAVGGLVAVSSSSAVEPMVVARLGFFGQELCSGALLESTTTSGIAGDSGLIWADSIAGNAVSPAGAVSALVSVMVSADDASAYRVYLDSLYLRDEAIYVDGFETGDTSRWSETVP